MLQRSRVRLRDFVLHVVSSRGGMLLALMLCIAMPGCYDVQALIHARRAEAARAQLVEVDLGAYRISLPRPFPESERAEVNFHAFGQIAHRDLPLAKKTLDEFAPKLHHRLLLAVRQMRMSEIVDPSLESLRSNIAEVVNEMVVGDPVKSVGFYSFTFSNY